MNKLNKNSILNGMSIFYLFCSIFAFLLLFVSPNAAILVYAPGASSGYIAFGLATSDLSICKFLRIMAMIWALGFSVVFVFCLVWSAKKQYRHMSIFMLLDSIIAIAWFFYCYIKGDTYWSNLFGADALISPIFAFIFIYLAWSSKKKTEDGSAF